MPVFDGGEERDDVPETVDVFVLRAESVNDGEPVDVFEIGGVSVDVLLISGVLLGADEPVMLRVGYIEFVSCGDDVAVFEGGVERVDVFECGMLRVAPDVRVIALLLITVSEIRDVCVDVLDCIEDSVGLIALLSRFRFSRLLFPANNPASSRVMRIMCSYIVYRKNGLALDSLLKN